MSVAMTMAAVQRSARIPRRRGAGKGFTLVELLIALVLITIITVLMFSGLRLGSRAWEGVETVSDQINDVRVARNFIDQTLRQTRAASVVFDGTEWPIFAGDSEGLEFAAPLSEHVGIPGLYILRLVLEPAAEGERLVLVRWLLHPEVLAGGDDYPAWEPLLEGGQSLADAGPLDQDIAAGAYGRTVLLPQVSTFELAYFGVPKGESEPEWLQAWADEARLPRQVRMTLSTPSQSWPDALIVLPDGDLGPFGGLGGLPLSLDEPALPQPDAAPFDAPMDRGLDLRDGR